MSTLLGIIGILGSVGCVIFLIISLIKKTGVKKPVVGLIVCFCLLVISFSISKPDAKKTSTAKEKITNSASKEKPKEQKAKMTTGQKNALESAKDYLDFSALSHSGLVEQLKFEGYSKEDSTFAADNCGANWDEQAAKSAKTYIDMSSFSRAGLIDQLEFDGYTHSQAEYGANAVGY